MLRQPWKVADQVLQLPVLRRQVRGATFSYLAARTLFFDEEVNRALDDGIGRVVMVGAGYDSRAWRLAARRSSSSRSTTPRPRPTSSGGRPTEGLATCRSTWLPTCSPRT